MCITEFNSMKSDQPVSNISVQRPFLPQNVKHCDIQFTDLGYFNEKKPRIVIMNNVDFLYYHDLCYTLSSFI